MSTESRDATPNDEERKVNGSGNADILAALRGRADAIALNTLIVTLDQSMSNDITIKLAREWIRGQAAIKADEAFARIRADADVRIAEAERKQPIMVMDELVR